jgi:hypothetical protein
MNNRRLTLLVIALVIAVIATVQWYLAAERLTGHPEKTAEPAELQTSMRVVERAGVVTGQRSASFEASGGDFEWLRGV